MELQQPTKRYQSGFSAVEIFLFFLIVSVLSVTGLVLYQRHLDSHSKNNTATSPSQTTVQQKSSTTKINTPDQVTSTAFVSSLLGTLTSGDETQLGQLLTPAFKNYRRQYLVAGHCNNPPTQS